MKYRIQEIIIDEEKEIDLKSDHNMIITELKNKRTSEYEKYNSKQLRNGKERMWTGLNIKKK